MAVGRVKRPDWAIRENVLAEAVRSRVDALRRPLRPVPAFLVLAAGVASVGYGLYLDYADPCVAGSGITVERLGPNESSDVPGETVRYEDLPPRGREAFDEALADLRNGSGESGSSEIHPEGVGGLGGGVVVHEGTRYGVIQFVNACGDPGVVFLLGGVAASAVGLAALVLTGLWSWLRG